MPHHCKVPTLLRPQRVLFKAKKLFKDKTYSVFEEMPKELYELRKAQLKNCRMRKREVTQRTLVKNIQISFS